MAEQPNSLDFNELNQDDFQDWLSAWDDCDEDAMLLAINEQKQKLNRKAMSADQYDVARQYLFLFAHDSDEAFDNFCYAVNNKWEDVSLHQLYAREETK